MASLPTIPKAHSKQTISARDKWRARTNYAPRRYTGFAPIPMAAFAEIGRLKSGEACCQLLYVILAASVGQRVPDNQPFESSTEEMTTHELAELCNCDERTIQRELISLAQRKVITYTQRKKGLFVITPLLKSWASLSDYKPGPVLEPETDEPPAPEDQVTEKQDGYQKLTTKPVAVRAGQSSRKLKVEVGVKEIYCKSNVDLHFEAVVQGGSLLVSLIGHQWKPEAKSGSVKTKGFQANQRHGCRHPRAAEVAGLFDPFLLKQPVPKSLSGDPSALQACCELIANVPNEFLVKAVIERAARPVKSPGAAIAICKEVAHNWEKVKNLPPSQRLPSPEEIDAMIAQERAELAAKRKKIRAEEQEILRRRRA